MQGIDNSRLYVHDGGDDTVRDGIEGEEFFYVRGSEGLVDEVLHDATIVVEECDFGARIALVNS